MPEMSTRYSALSENDVYRLFLTPSWGKLNFDDRHAALQELEIRMARRTGRKPCRVNIVTHQDSPNVVTRGYFDPSDGTINLNAKFLEPTGFYLKSGFTVAKAIATLIHEGRHAYQYEMTDQKRFGDKAVMRWNVNQYTYISTGDPRWSSVVRNPDQRMALYFFQPVERDARQFESREFRRIYRTLYKLTGTEDPALKKGLEIMLETKRLEFDKARTYLTPEVLDRVEKHIALTHREQFRGDRDYRALLAAHGMDSETSMGILDELRGILQHPEWQDRYCDGLDDMGLDDLSDLDEFDTERIEASEMPDLNELLRELLDGGPGGSDKPDQGGWKENRRGM